MDKMPILQTKRLILKQGTYNDYLKVYEYDFTKLRNIAGEEEYIKLDAKRIKEYSTYHIDEKNNVFDFIIYIKDDMIPIGNIILDNTDEIADSLEIAFNLHPNYWRNGYMMEAILKIMDYVYSNTNTKNIIYGYADDNYKSKKLNEKLRFKIYDEYMEYYPRLNKNIKTIKTIMSKELYEQLYK